MSTFSQRHYQVVAQSIRRQWDEAEVYASDVGAADGVFALQELAKDLADQFEEDNPAFKRDLFMEVAVNIPRVPRHRDSV